MHGLDHGPDPEEHPSEERRDVLAGQELPPAGHQEERQDRNVDIPGWSLIMAAIQKGDFIPDAVASGEAGLGG